MNGEEAAENAADRSQLDRLQQPGSHMLPQRHERTLIAEKRLHLRRVVQSVACRQRVHHEHIEDADCAKRAHDSDGDTAGRVAGFLAEGRSGVETDEGQQAEDDSEPDPGNPLGEDDTRKTAVVFPLPARRWRARPE